MAIRSWACPHELVDGAVLVVTTSGASDRTGREYDGAIQPDVRVDTDWTRIGADDDPVVRAAATWLAAQPQCRAEEGRR